MPTFEIVVLAYFTYLAFAAWRAQAPAGQRWRVVAIAAALISLVLTLTLVPSGPTIATLRDWLPATYILVGYWLPAFLIRAPHLTLERWLLALDDRLLLRRGVWLWLERAPRVWLEYLELSYLLCYPLVPAAFAILYFSGGREHTDRFWTAVLLAVYSCYGLLPWLPTRAPRSLEGSSGLYVRDVKGPFRRNGPDTLAERSCSLHSLPLIRSTHPLDRRGSRIRALNLRVLQHGSVTWNTFPSGHAAGGVAAALSVMVELPIVGVALLFLAISIMIGSVLGRYHYAADAVAGAAVAIAANILAALIA